MELKGHSGCRLRIIEYNEKQAVVKISKDIHYNDRLKKQQQLQKNFRSEIFKTPEIFSEQKNELYEFTMEYISGPVFADWLQTAPINQVQFYAKMFCDYIDSFYPGNCTEDPEASQIIYNKLQSLDIEKEDSLYQVAKTYLKTVDWHIQNSYYCHGDLTLENVIVSNNTLYVIDLLDSFYNSWQIDIAKVLQDTWGLWHYRFITPNENLLVRLKIFNEIIIEHIISSMPGSKGLMESISALVLLHFLRIVPYIEKNDKQTKEFVLGKVSTLLQKFLRKEFILW